jgi:hypothetical protein
MATIQLQILPTDMFHLMIKTGLPCRMVGRRKAAEK